VQPVNSAARQLLLERDDRAKVAKRDKGKKSQEGEDEPAKRDAEKQQIVKLAGEQGSVEDGTNPTAIYELCGGFGRTTGRRTADQTAMVTHKGASADSGHYIGWSRKEGSLAPSGEEEWFKFDGQSTGSEVCSLVLIGR